MEENVAPPTDQQGQDERRVDVEEAAAASPDMPALTRTGPGSGANNNHSAEAEAAAAPTAATATPAAAPETAGPSHQQSGSESRPADDAPRSPGLTVPHFVAPSSYLRFKAQPPSDAMTAQVQAQHEAAADSQDQLLSPLDRDQRQGLTAIRDFLKVRTSYDVLPLSFRLIILDTDLLIKKSLNILTQNSIVSAPLWDSRASRFAGLLTSTDYINLIQYHCQYPDEISKLDKFRIRSLRDIEKAIGAEPIETLSVNPSRPLYEACTQMLKTRARRIPLIDIDDETGRETVISVITQYRILKFIAVNNEHNSVLLKKSVRDISLGSYDNLISANMESTVLDVVHLMVDHNISCIPIVDENNRLLNAFEAVDVIPLIKGGSYEELGDTVGEALCKRPEDSPGIYTCNEDDRLDSLFDAIRKSRVHRFLVIDDDNKLKGVISLSDVLKYVLIWGEGDDQSSHKS